MTDCSDCRHNIVYSRMDWECTKGFPTSDEDGNCPEFEPKGGDD